MSRIQLYLKDSLLYPDGNVRLSAVKAVQLVLRQGLVHPIQIDPYLICISTDSLRENALQTGYHLQDIDEKYPLFYKVIRKAAVGRL